MKTKFIIFLLVLLVCIGGYFYLSHASKIKSEKNQIKNFVLNDQAQVRTLFNAMSTGSSITFGDAITLCEKTISSREDTLIKLRSLTIEDFEPTKDSMVHFFEKESDLIRAYLLETHKLLSLTTAEDEEKDARNDYYESSYYSSSYSYNRYKRSMDKTLEAIEDYHNSKNDFEAEYWNVIPSEQLFLTQLKKVGIDLMPSFESYRKKLGVKNPEEKRKDSLARVAVRDSLLNETKKISQ